MRRGSRGGLGVASNQVLTLPLHPYIWSHQIRKTGPFAAPKLTDLYRNPRSVNLTVASQSGEAKLDRGDRERGGGGVARRYLAHKEPHSPLAPVGHSDMHTVGSFGGGATPYERGTPAGRARDLSLEEVDRCWV